MCSTFSGDETASFFGFFGTAAALVFSCMGAAYGTAKSGVGVASMGVMRPELVMKLIVPVVMAGVLGLACDLVGLSIGMAIGIVGDAGVSYQNLSQKDRPRVAEAEAIRLALFTAVSKGWRKIILESDAKELVELIEGVSTNQLGDIVTLIADIHHLQGLCEDLVFRVIKRQANSLAHFSAQQGLSASLSRFHSQSFPSQLSPGAPSTQAQGPAQGSL
ncbi:hypothetical protein HHK36_027393 [Tetracentron sinense]|uniref:V-type proton ATPase proteolipid subunit n=1 Tax=Tetracentron sinense TaxID=13715 RepID=A0A834YCY7_TETSI|nr:hypothetical protein HHK36_027393 [Tetracentron sinense]